MELSANTLKSDTKANDVPVTCYALFCCFIKGKRCTATKFGLYANLGTIIWNFNIGEDQILLVS